MLLFGAVGRAHVKLKKGELSKYDRLVLTNAIYFKGLWARPFRKEHTTDDKFRVSASQTASVRMMRAQLATALFEGNGMKLAVLPYQGKTWSMIVIVPDEPDGLAAVERELTAKRVREWLTTGYQGDVNLQLPRLKARERYGALEDFLIQMGMQRPFSPGADFSGITDKHFMLKKVIHEAVVEVDEEGTEAAAATAIIGGVPVSPPVQRRSCTIRADRPFLFLIIDQSSQSILFLARVSRV